MTTVVRFAPSPTGYIHIGNARTALFNWLFGINLYERAPSMVVISVAVGVLGLLATWLFHRWAHNPQRPRLARFLDNSMTGSSLRRARAEMDALKEFERE